MSTFPELINQTVNNHSILSFVSVQAVATFTQRKEVSYTENTTAATSQVSSQRVMEMEESDAGVRTFPRIPPTPPERVHATPTREEQPPMQVADEQVFHQQVRVCDLECTTCSSQLFVGILCCYLWYSSSRLFGKL